MCIVNIIVQWLCVCMSVNVCVCVCVLISVHKQINVLVLWSDMSRRYQFSDSVSCHVN